MWDKLVGRWELYDLQQDRTETHDLSSEFPERVQLAADYDRVGSEYGQSTRECSARQAATEVAQAEWWKLGRFTAARGLPWVPSDRIVPIPRSTLQAVRAVISVGAR